MKKEYYRLDLRKVNYMALVDYIKDNDEYIYEKIKFIPRELKELNYLYFKKEDKNTYTEFITKNPIIVENNNIIYPYGIDIQLYDLVPCKSSEALFAFDRLKKSEALIEYNQIINDILVNSNIINNEKTL